jgi:hypothetical protein
MSRENEHKSPPCAKVQTDLTFGRPVHAHEKKLNSLLTDNVHSVRNGTFDKEITALRHDAPQNVLLRILTTLNRPAAQSDRRIHILL